MGKVQKENVEFEPAYPTVLVEIDFLEDFLDFLIDSLLRPKDNLEIQLLLGQILLSNLNITALPPYEPLQAIRLLLSHLLKPRELV